MSESPEHKHIKKVLRHFFSSQYGVAINEYYDSGFEIDVFSVTISSITIMVETIWTATNQNFYRDLTIVLSSNAQIKIVIVNPKILENDELVRYFERIKVSEAEKGYSVIGMLGWNFSDEDSLLKELKNEIDKILKEKEETITKKIGDLKKDIFNHNVSLASIVSKCLDLAKKVNLLDDIQWLKAELYGYYGYIKKGKKQSIEDLPGKPYYRRVFGKTTFYFPRAHGPGETVEKDFPLVITQPIHEIETWISGMSPSAEIVIYLPPPEFLLRIAKKYGVEDPEQKMPIILTRLKLESIVNGLRTELHKFIDKISEELTGLN